MAQMGLRLLVVRTKKDSSSLKSDSKAVDKCTYWAVSPQVAQRAQQVVLVAFGQLSRASVGGKSILFRAHRFATNFGLKPR